jgi:hypothetical protein
MTAIPFLFTVPLFAIGSAVMMYRFNGRRQMLKFDLIQFIYAFVLSPILFICLKTFMYVLLKTELGLSLSVTELFWIDTIFSVLCFYIFGFVVIHSLTTSFKLVLLKDPLADLFEYSEYFHLWLSHIVIYGGSGLILTVIGVANIFFPFAFQLNKVLFYSSMGLAVLGGVIGFVSIWLSDPKQARYMKIIKLLLGFYFLIHAVAYFIFDPALNMPYVLYWATFTMFIVMVIISLFAHRSHRATRFFNTFKYKKGWGKNIKLFKDKQ